MNRLLALPRLFRLPNLAIVFLTQWIPYWLVLRPAILRAGGIPALTDRTFGLIAAATLLTTLAGYVINDFYDYRIDLINKPQRVVVGKYFHPLMVLGFYLALVGCVFFLSFQLDAELPTATRRWPLWVFPAVSFCLFLYAWQLKCTAFIGNLLVALLCALVPIIVLLPEERPLLLLSYQDAEALHRAVSVVWLYALFAFLTNLLREQIKDLEDFEGDAACGCNTLAVLKGPAFARKPAALTGVLMCLLFVFLLYFWNQTGALTGHLIAGAVLLLLPALFTTAAIFTASGKRDFSRASLLIKAIMVIGLFLLLRPIPSDWPIMFKF